MVFKSKKGENETEAPRFLLKESLSLWVKVPGNGQSNQHTTRTGFFPRSCQHLFVRILYDRSPGFGVTVDKGARAISPQSYSTATRTSVDIRHLLNDAFLVAFLGLPGCPYSQSRHAGCSSS
jgi:hypothetical protein